MDFLKRNSGKIALLALIAFFTMPFIYGNEEEEDFSPFAVRSGMSYQANPISKLANRIASFYGFSKPASATMASANTAGSIKDKVADHHTFHKESVAKAKAQGDTLLASSRNFKNFDTEVLDDGLAGTKSSASVRNSTASSSGNSHNGYYGSNTNNPVKGYVKVNGKDYAVIEDATGERYVVTPKGHIAYRDLVKRTISDAEFLEAKKRLNNASDIEVLQALQQEKAQNAAAHKAQRQNYQANATSYRNGTVSSMGGNNAVRVSTSDKGFDDNALSDAYADLKSINFKIEESSSSQKGGSSGGSYLRDSFGGRANDSQQSGQDAAPLSPAQVVADQVKANLQQDFTTKDHNDNYVPQEEVRNHASFEIVKLTENKTYETTNNNTSMIFISTDEENSPYEVWGRAGKYPFKGGKERNGIITYIYPDNNGGLGYSGNESDISYYVKDINQSIEDIKEMMYEFNENDKVYIDTSTMDDFSKALLIDNSVLSDYITDNPEKASIKLSGPICTPDSFKQFVEELEQKQIKLLAERKGNSAV